MPRFHCTRVVTYTIHVDAQDETQAKVRAVALGRDYWSGDFFRSPVTIKQEVTLPDALEALHAAQVELTTSHMRTHQTVGTCTTCVVLKEIARIREG